jgi:hypothetical protein
MSVPVSVPSAARYTRPQPIPGNPKALNQDEKYIPYKAPTMQTPYMVMSVQANEASTWHNALAAIFSWLILAGYVVFPGTFTSLQNSDSLNNSGRGKFVQYTVKNVPLLPVAGVCCIVGTVGIYRLWRKWWKNYVWLIARICL